MDVDVQSIEKTSHNKLIILILILLIVTVTIITKTFLIFFNLFKSDQNKIHVNTYLSYNKNTISISKLSSKAALNSLKISKQKYLSTQVIFIDGKTKIKATLENMGIKLNMNALKNCIKNNMYSDSFFNYIPQKINHSNLKIKFENYISLDKTVFKSFIYKDLSKINVPATNASVKVVNGNLFITNSYVGKHIDNLALLNKILNDIKNHKSIVILPMKTLQPTITKINAKKMMPTNFLSSFTTYYGSSSYARKTNIALAASRINNCILPPNGTFEFYKAIGGEPTYNMGYMSAPMYVNGQVVPGVGGGMCQVATTLYNAVLKSDLKILERYNHALPVHYISLGLDAAVAYGCNTLRFQNNTNGFLLVKSEFDGSNLTFSIYGHEKLKNKISVCAYNLGCNSATAYRYVYNKNGNLIRKDFLGQSTYK